MILKEENDKNTLTIGGLRYGRINGWGRVYVNEELSYEGFFRKGFRHGWGREKIVGEDEGEEFIREGLFIQGRLEKMLKGNAISDSLFNNLALIFYHVFRS